MIKRKGGKKKQEETEKQQQAIVRENNLCKDFTTKSIRNYKESTPATLTATVDGAKDLTARNFTQREKFNATPLSNLLDYFWS